jgi:hypothetical protein
MNEIINAIISFPGIVPSVLLGVVIIFGLFAIAGLLDLEHVGPHWHFDVDHPGDFNHLGGHDGHAHGLSELLVSIGFGRMPFFVVISAITFVWWALLMTAQLYLVPWIPLPNWLTGALLLVASFLMALPIAAMLIQPLKPIFADRGKGARPLDFVGRACKILTGNVDEKFGQAEVSVDPGSHHVVQVWARTPNSLIRGSSALILHFDASSKRFEVEAYDP